MKEPVDHVLRPQLPWRTSDAAITECGFDASKVKTITREQLHQRFRDMGRQRTVILTCMTCSETATRWAEWACDPRQAVEREIQWEQRGRWSSEDHGKRLHFELLAIAELIEAHREEFDQSVRRLHGVDSWQATKSEKQQARTRRRTRGRNV